MMDNKCNVFDVARYIIIQCGSMSVMKLQKLVYYSHAWTIVWSDELLFSEEIQAWASGPVVVDLYEFLKGQFRVVAADIPCGDISHLTIEQQENIQIVLEAYADKSTQWLSDLTRMETPWKDARKGLSDLERGDRIITPAAISEYYSSLAQEGENA